MTELAYRVIYDRIADAWYIQDGAGFYLAYDGVFRSVRREIDTYQQAYYETLEEAYAVLCDLENGPVRMYKVIGPSGIEDTVGGFEV